MWGTPGRLRDLEPPWGDGSSVMDLEITRTYF